MGGAVFLDRDGVLNENRPGYVKSWREFRWLPGVLEALALLAARATPVIVVTNQSMVGRGLAGAAALDEIHRRMRRQAQQAGGRIDGVYACLHAPTAACGCRKPLPGLLHLAAVQHGVDLAQSVLIGDALTDYLAALAAGVQYVHVCTGRGSEEAPGVLAANRSISVVRDLRAAVDALPAWPAPDRSAAWSVDRGGILHCSSDERLRLD